MEREEKIIKQNLQKVKGIITLASKMSSRTVSEIKLVVVTKGRSIEEIEAALIAGCSDFGENRINELEEKAEKLKGRGIVWHFIGHLQSNKARKAVEIAEYIHSVDSSKLLRKINNVAEELEKKQKVFLEINISGEESKFGLRENELSEILEEGKKLANVQIIGLMTMAPFVEAEKTLPVFKKLRELANKFNLKELSMGMTNDFEVAIEEGATFVRIGTAIFGN